MVARHAKSGGGGGGHGHNDPSDSKHEQKLQAVLLADSFTTTFRPVTLDPTTPRILCPLNNVTLLDYSVEFLAGAGVGEIYIFCVNGADEIQRYVDDQQLGSSRMSDDDNKNHTRAKSYSSVMVKCVKDTACSYPGDALRELDKLGLIRSDPFLLVRGDVVTNVDLAPALASHRARKKADATSIMTVLLRHVDDGSSSTRSPLRSVGDDLVVGLNPSNDRILLYDDDPSSSDLSIPCSYFTNQTSSIELHRDLYDVGVDVCSPEVLARFSDAFDYRHLRKQFVRDSVSEEEEGLQDKIYAHFLGGNEYAARIHDFRTYHATSRDLLRRWCYPVVPDNLPSGYEKSYRYALSRGGITGSAHYVYREVKGGRGRIARDTILGSNTMIGADCNIGNSCLVSGSVIGNHCRIGNDCRIVDSHMWEGARVEDGVKMTGVILCQDSVVRAGAVLGTGCVVGRGCVIGKGVVLEEYTRITSFRDVEGEDDFGDDEFSSSESPESSSSEEEEGDTTTSEDEEGDGDGEGEGEKPSGRTTRSASGDHTAPTSSWDHDVVGPDGVGRVWRPPPPEDESDYDSDKSDDGYGNMDEDYAALLVRSQSIGFDPTDLYRRRSESQMVREDREGEFLTDDDDEEDDDDGDEGYYGEGDGVEEEDGGPSGRGAEAERWGVTPPQTFSAPITGRQADVDVVGELRDMCLEHERCNSLANLAIEMNSFKFSQNATYADCCVGAVMAMLDSVDATNGPGRFVTELRKELEYWGPLFDKLNKADEEERAILAALESTAVGGGDLGDLLSREPAFRLLLQTVHDVELVNEGAILGWASERRREVDVGKNVNNGRRVDLFLQKPTQDFLEWLEEESESETDSEGGSDGSESS